MKSIFQLLRTFRGVNKWHAAINIFGFAVSLMFVVLIGLYIQDELRVDEQHAHAGRIYRLEHAKGVTFGSPTARALETRYPEVESTVRIWGCPDGQLYSPFMDRIYMGNVWYADSTLFDVFSFQFVEGDPHTALQSQNNVVLSESFARKLFGGEAALGQAIKTSKRARAEYIVSGVIRDIDRTHFRPVDMIFPMSKLKAEDRMFQMNFDAFGTRSYATYLLARPGADLVAKEAGMPAFFRELGDPAFVNDSTQTARLVPLREVYLHPAMDDMGLFRGNSATFVLILGLTAVLILVFAMINYINLSVAQTEFRAKGAAIRLLLGETRERLFAGFIGESIGMCVVSLLIGLGLAPEATEVAVNSQLKLKLKGRIRDFHFEDYTQPVGPVVVSTLPAYERPYQILIRVSRGDPYGVRERIRLFNNERTGGETFDGRFLDERIAAQYDQQRQMAGIIGTLSVVAIVISALGMLAMATYYTRQREREVAVRKVFGSTTGEVLLRVLGSFGKMVGVAFMVAVPIILYLMRGWLEGYAYRIPLSWTIFALAGAVALFIAGSSVLWQSIRTAHTNPVDVLRK